MVDTMRRQRIYAVEQDFLVDAWNYLHAPPEKLRVPVMPSIPADARVIAVSPNFDCRTLDFLVEHESFEPVDICFERPRFSVHALNVEWKTLTVTPD